MQTHTTVSLTTTTTTTTKGTTKDKNVNVGTCILRQGPLKRALCFHRQVDREANYAKSYSSRWFGSFL